MDNEFSGKTALVTGASRGIGAATAAALARQGVRRFLLQYNSYPEGAAQTAAAIQDLGGEAVSVQADLSQPAGIHSFIQQIQQPVDILINNAGSLWDKLTATGYSKGR